jgi:hypothetical protein
MINVCAKCGAYHVDKTVRPIKVGWAEAICPACGHPHRFRFLPLLVVAGASGTGKSTLCRALTGSVTEAVLLDLDILWRPAFDQPETGYRDFFETWLRLAKNIGQAGRPVTFFNAGAGVPSRLELCLERRYLAQIHRLALTCDDDTLANRLRARPNWRQSSGDSFIQDQIAFNRWYREVGPTLDPPITVLDTSTQTVDATADAVRDWIQEHVSPTSVGPQ